MKHIFIINPVAGKGQAVQFKEKIEYMFKSIDDDYEIIVTKEILDATKEVKKRTDKEDCRVYSIGGDGTLNEVLNGVIGSNSSLAVIPAGSGNDFARTLYEGYKYDNILKELVNGDEKTIDIAKLNDRYYLNISSIGFDASVVYNAREYKKKKFISGNMAYTISLIKTLFTFKPMEFTFELNGKVVKDYMYLITAANGKYYGGGIKIAPNAKIDDGLLEIYAIKKPKLHRLIRFLPKVVQGKDISGVEEIKHIRCNKLSVKSEVDTKVNLDGEIFTSKDITFEAVPKAIKVIVPKNIQ
ncbi:MAG: diacylglycerol/lipid kinase family protein [Clostridium sp.]|uniref:diacylglycerol/lipid kinase family protein n=1 Tax=Clostridium sp. TaxID=1506 RepID=UPI003F333215